MADEHDHEEHGDTARPGYDPSNKELPSREPPLRSTAPQSEYSTRDVGVGFAVLLVGVALTFGLAIGLV